MIDYLRDPEEIYRLSFAAARAACDLDGLSPAMRSVAIRLVHACGMPEIIADLAWSGDAAERGRAALADGAPVLVDARMVAAGINRASLPRDNDIVCIIGDEETAARAHQDRTTRSAAAVDLWGARIGGAVVAIGNAPTALFRLLELVEEGAPMPALVLGFPVGFIGAAESKAALIERGGVPLFIALAGRKGGSALASAAVNALAMDTL